MVYFLEDFKETGCMTAVGSLYLPNEVETISAVIVVTIVFQFVLIVCSVEIDIARSFFVFVQWIEEITSDSKRKR